MFRLMFCLIVSLLLSSTASAASFRGVQFANVARTTTTGHYHHHHYANNFPFYGFNQFANYGQSYQQYPVSANYYQPPQVIVQQVPVYVQPPQQVFQVPVPVPVQAPCVGQGAIGYAPQYAPQYAPAVGYAPQYAPAVGYAQGVGCQSFFGGAGAIRGY